MGRLMISSSQMCISREQEEFLASYRTDQARQAFIDSYGKQNVNFLDVGYKGESVINYFHWFDSFVEYIGVSSEDFGPYIETDLILESNDNSVIDLKFFYDGFSNNYPMIISNDWDTILPYFNVHFHDNNLRIAPLNHTYIFFPVVSDGFYHVIIDNFNGDVEVNGNKMTTRQLTIRPNDKPLKIFSPLQNTRIDGKFYELKIYQYGKLTHHYLPVQKEGVGFVFDMIDLKPWYNLGTGSFVVGPYR